MISFWLAVFVVVWTSFGIFIAGSVLALISGYEHLFGFKTKLINYGNDVRAPIYFKIAETISVLDFNGKQEISIYILRDKATRWSRFYVWCRVVNGRVSAVSEINFQKINPGSELQKFLDQSPPPNLDALSLISFKENLVQRLIDQINFDVNALDPAKF